MFRALQALFAASLLAACGATEVPSPPDQRLTVYATSFPAYWLVQRICGNAVHAVNVLPAGEDPLTFQPSPEVLAELTRADLIVANGAGYERWMRTAPLPADRVVYTAVDVPPLRLEAGTDPHTWLDPSAYLSQAEALHAALLDADPMHAVIFDAGLASLRADLTTLEAELDRVLSHAAPLASSHPSYRYLARRFDLQITPFDLDPSTVPSVIQRARFAVWAGAREAPILLWATLPDPQVVRSFPPGVRHLVVDPLEQPPPERPYDYLAQARGNLAVLASTH